MVACFCCTTGQENYFFPETVFYFFLNIRKPTRILRLVYGLSNSDYVKPALNSNTADYPLQILIDA